MNYKIRIPQPCHENWYTMNSTEKGKFCKSCAKEVIDFTKLTDKEISKKIVKGKPICGRFKETQLNRDLKIIGGNNFSKVAASLAFISLFSVSETIFSQTQKVPTEILSKQGNFVLSIKGSIEKYITIHGTIKDVTGSLPGVSILLKESTNGTETDFDGNFSLKIPNKKLKSTILVISYLGYETQEIDILQIKKPLVINMKESESEMGETIISAGMIAISENPNIFELVGDLFRKKENKRY